jgi:hypothetical protein
LVGREGVPLPVRGEDAAVQDCKTEQTGIANAAGSPLHGFECATTTFAYVLGHGSGASCGGRGREGRGVVGGGGEIRVETEANGVMPSGLRSPRKRRRWCRSRIEVVLEKDGARQG